jgi:hypothetical protein
MTERDACKAALRRLNYRLWQRGTELTPKELSEWREELEAAIEGEAGAATPQQTDPYVVAFGEAVLKAMERLNGTLAELVAVVRAK